MLDGLNSPILYTSHPTISCCVVTNKNLHLLSPISSSKGHTDRVINGERFTIWRYLFLSNTGSGDIWDWRSCCLIPEVETYGTGGHVVIEMIRRCVKLARQSISPFSTAFNCWKTSSTISLTIQQGIQLLKDQLTIQRNISQHKFRMTS